MTLRRPLSIKPILKRIELSSLPIIVTICFLLLAIFEAQSQPTIGGNGSKELNKGKILQKMIENLDPNILKLVGINYSGGVLKILEDESLMNGQDGGQVQKFHPNGRYGRSMNRGQEPPSGRIELAQVKMPSSLDQKTVWQFLENQANRRRRGFGKEQDELDTVPSDNGISNYQSEMSKLLKCSFTGVYNLYMCDN